MDLSPLRKWEVLGPDAEALIQCAVTRDIRRLAVGQVVYTARLQRDRRHDRRRHRLPARPTTTSASSAATSTTASGCSELAERLGLKVWVKPSTDQLHNLAVQGPESREIMKQLVWTPPTQPLARRAQVVPLPRRAHRRLRRDPGRRVAHGLHGRARLRGLLPPRRRPGRLGRDLGGRRSRTGSSRSGSRRST